MASDFAEDSTSPDELEQEDSTPLPKHHKASLWTTFTSPIVSTLLSVSNQILSVLKDVSGYYFKSRYLSSKDVECLTKTRFSKKIYRFASSRRNPVKYYRQLMKLASCYEQWAASGYMLDRCEGKDKWKNDERSNDYDYKLIRDRLEMLKSLRKNGDLVLMIMNLRTSICRSLGDMGNPKLYNYTHVGTKLLIEDYIDEVTKQLNYIADCDSKDYPTAKKLQLFTNLQRAFGRSALLLSGGGAFGLSHIGVLKVLYEMQLLPKIISGSSGGSIVAAVLCTRLDEDKDIMLSTDYMNLNVFERPEEQGNPFLRIIRLLKHGVMFDVQVFTDAMRQNLGDITFQEAYNRTGKILNITVSSSTSYEMPRLLNYLSAPNVLIWSAVAASCAVPLVYRSAPLMAKDKAGNFVHWNPSGHKWIDGSVENDLPMQRISELFGVNHFIVSQVNPHIIPLMSNHVNKPSAYSDILYRVGHLVMAELQHRCQQLADVEIFPWIFGKLHSMLCQTYYGDITIVPHLSWFKYPHLLGNPSRDLLNDFSIDGELSTWPCLAIIRNHCQIELCIQQNIRSLREKLIYETHAITPSITNGSLEFTERYYRPVYMDMGSGGEVRRHTTGNELTRSVRDSIPVIIQRKPPHPKKDASKPQQASSAAEKEPTRIGKTSLGSSGPGSDTSSGSKRRETSVDSSTSASSSSPVARRKKTISTAYVKTGTLSSSTLKPNATRQAPPVRPASGTSVMSQFGLVMSKEGSGYEEDLDEDNELRRNRLQRMRVGNYSAGDIRQQSTRKE